MTMGIPLATVTLIQNVRGVAVLLRLTAMFQILKLSSDINLVIFRAHSAKVVVGVSSSQNVNKVFKEIAVSDAYQIIQWRQEGRTAYYDYKNRLEQENADTPQPTNPYPKDTEAAKKWSDGWLDAALDT